MVALYGRTLQCITSRPLYSFTSYLQEHVVAEYIEIVSSDAIHSSGRQGRMQDFRKEGSQSTSNKTQGTPDIPSGLEEGYMYDNDEEMAQRPNIAYQTNPLGLVPSPSDSSPILELPEGYMYDNDEEMEQRPNVAYQARLLVPGAPDHDSSPIQELAEGYVYDNEEEMTQRPNVAYQIGPFNNMSEGYTAKEDMPQETNVACSAV